MTFESLAAITAVSGYGAIAYRTWQGNGQISPERNPLLWRFSAIMFILLLVHSSVSEFQGKLGMFFMLSLSITWIIAKACDYFEGAADFLGRNMPPGVKGATINAVGSSMPELLTTFALLFFLDHAGAFGAGIALTAGSAVFNSVFIPLCVVIAVTATVRLGRIAWAAQKGEIKIDKASLWRDGSALMIAEVVLIFLLSKETLTAVDGLILMGIYVVYAGVMWYQSKNHINEDDDDDEEHEHTTKSAWIVVGVSVAVLVGACHLLAETVVGTAELFEVNAFIVAIFLGAAASSVPDTILSVKDARKGNEDDAISNAVGSNTFDICVALGLPLFIYASINGPIAMPEHDGIQTLRIGLVLITAAVLALFLWPKVIKLWHAGALAVIYAIWTIFALNAEFGWF